MTDNLPVNREMLNEALDQVRRGEGVEVDVHELRRRVLAEVQRRPLPANAYVRPGLGDLPLSVQLDGVIKMLTDLLKPLVVKFEDMQPEVLECSVCRRNLGGWPVQVLQDHYWQHTWLQRRLAAIGVR